MNDERTFDRFAVEQLAGDLLPGSTVAHRVATGFARGTPVSVEAGVDQEENRVDGVVDRGNTVSTVWFRSTIACSRSSDRKDCSIIDLKYYELFS